MKKQNYFLILILAGLITASSLVYFAFKAKVNIPSITTNQNHTSQYLPTTSQLVGTNISLEASSSSAVSVNLDPVITNNISGISFRIIYSNEVNEPQVTITPNPDLISAGWLFPIKQTNLDPATKTITIDFSGIMASPSGYTLTKKINLANISFTSTFSSLTNLQFDKTQTKLIGKDGNEILLND